MKENRKTILPPKSSSNSRMDPGAFGDIPTEKAKDFKGTLKRLLHYIKPHSYQLLFVMIAALLSTIFGIVSPKIMGNATTKLFEGVMLKLNGIPGAEIDFNTIQQIILLLGGLYILSAGFSYIQQYLMAEVAQKTVYDLRKHVEAKLSRLPLTFFDTHTTGEILSRAVNDIDNISSTLQQNLTQMITSIITIIGVIVMMLTISPLLAFIVLLTLPLSLIVTKVVASHSQGYFIEQQQSLGNLNSHVEEMLTGHVIIKSFGREDQSIAVFQKINEKLYHSGWRSQFISGIIMPLMSFISNISYVIISIIGGVLVTKGSIEIGDIQALIQYTRQFSQPITQLATIVNIVQSTLASAERIFELLDEQEAVPEITDAKIILSPKGNIAFQNVTFGYREDLPLIEHMNLTVKQGQTIAIVGPTGAGKTTLINLLMRFYELNDGTITIDDIAIQDLKRHDLYNMFGMVLQDTWLFNGTIRANIAYGREDATEEQIVQAAKAAHADFFIKSLADGYNTILNEEASNISQGQKQLLTIARALLRDPVILILDEATSSVDTRTEVLIQKAMNELIKGRTSFIIAHRLSTIRNADLILVMKNGTVIEKGTHEELLAKGSFYADLYNSQFTENV